MVVVAAIAAGALVLRSPRGPTRSPAALAWLGCLALAPAVAGLGVGAERLASIDDGALELPSGGAVTVRGFVTAVPSRSRGEVRVRVETAAGRVLLVAPEPVGELAVGAAVRARGTARTPREWERARLRRLGVRLLVRARRITTVAGARGGVTGVLDGIRARAERALGEGTDPAAANLLRGFVLGQDDRIDESTVEEFKASGLAHLLAVSGQNVILLAILAAVVLAVLDVPLRARLAWVLGLIAVYVPVAGAGASIQRAGVMGAAGIVAVLAGRPRSRWYALLLAAAVTLAIDPRASADVGWQLSFAAVIGILLAAGPIASALAPAAHGWRRGLADGVALTIAATLATAPLMAHQFGVVSSVALPANLVALPAVAPVMWLGMLAAAAGQIPWLPADPLTWAAGLLAAYIAQVAEWFAAPAWAELELRLESPVAVAIAYATLAATASASLAWAGRRRRLRPRGPGARARAPALAALMLAVSVVLTAIWPAGEASDRRPAPGLRLTVLDVGQGDSILVEPGPRRPLLVDAGPAGAGVAAELERRGVERLGALAITHPEADHDGGAAEVLARIATDRLLYARARPATLRSARGAGARPVRVAAGTRLRSGALRLEVLWPPAERLTAARRAPPADPNSLSLALLLRWRGFSALLAGDAEAEDAPLDPGEIEVLKLAHHGSEDAGLEPLLESTSPRLALISSGAENPYGHPAPSTLAALTAAGVRVLRTDEAGAITVEVRGGDWTVR